MKCVMMNGLLYIVTSLGLTILAGLVVYISTFKGEISNKLRPMSEFQDALFNYRYGFSFLMLVASLITCEISGLLSIFLYISQKQFEIMLDAEREEVLKKTLLNLLTPDITKPINHDGHTRCEQPMLRIICEDENGAPIPSNVSPVDHNFLSPEFGLDPSMYLCGRHGTRGRRNSRSNESFIGSSRESVESRSRKNSFTSMQDEPSHSSAYVTEHQPEPKRHDQFEHETRNLSMDQAKTDSGPLLELHVPSLAQLRPFGEMPRPSKKPARFQYGSPFEVKSDKEEIPLPYVVSLPSPPLQRPQSSATNSNSRKRLSKQSSLNINPTNRSTYV